MALSFPNPSRNYDGSVHGVRFWGYDQTFEITFFIEAGALLKISSNTKADEMGFLETFDVNLNRIHKLAGKIYSRRRKASRIFSFTMSVSDL
jgi:hypothetical protein